MITEFAEQLESERREYVRSAVDSACLLSGTELTDFQHRVFMRSMLNAMTLGETMGQLRTLDDEARRLKIRLA